MRGLIGTGLLVAAPVVGGCAVSASPRSATIAPGAWTVMVTQPLGGYEPGRTAGERRGNTIGGFAGVLGVLAGGSAVSGEVSRSLGRCELGGIVGFERLGAETRCQLSERPLAVTPFVRGGYQPGAFFLRRGPWFAAGLDMSRGVVAFSPTLSSEQALHHIAIESSGIDENRAILTGRREWRVSAPIGVVLGWQATKSVHMRVTVGITPYLTVSHGTPTCLGSCEEAERALAATFEQELGALITVAIGPTIR